MIQIEFPQPFCNTHNDYLMEILRMDYLVDDCSRLCKICRKEQKNYEQIEEQREKIEKFIEELNNAKIATLQKSLQEKIDGFCESISKNLFTEMKQLLEQFQQIRDEIIAKKNNKEELQQFIDENKQEVIDKIISVKHNVIDIIYNSVANVDKMLFLEKTYNQQIDDARIPPIHSILQNYDSYNLLLQLQFYLKKMSYLRQEDFERTCKLNATSFIDELDSQERKLNILEGKLQDKITEETNKLMERFKRYKGFSTKNYEVLREFVTNMSNQGRLQIQEMNEQNLQRFTNYETAMKYFQQLQSEQRQSFSRLAHLGRIDIDISLEEIQSCFEFNFIPINAQQQIVSVPNLNFEKPLQEPISRLKVNLNKNGQFDGEARIEISNGSQGDGQFNDGNLIGKQIQQTNKRQLFNLDLSVLTKNKENTFVYKEIKDLNREIYEEVQGRWTLTRDLGDNNTEGLWILYVAQNIQIKNLKINFNKEVDQNQEVVFVSPENPKENIQQESNYTGTINNSFQYQGRGRLVLTQKKKPIITKEGNWNQGKLEGQGKIYQNNEIFYEGNFIDGLRSGQGIEYFPQGYFYEGEFKDDKKHGSGIIRRKLQINGKLEEMEIEKCNWQNDQPVMSNCQIF